MMKKPQRRLLASLTAATLILALAVAPGSQGTSYLQSIYIHPTLCRAFRPCADHPVSRPGGQCDTVEKLFSVIACHYSELGIVGKLWWQE